jgi:hypothetical protein
MLGEPRELSLTPTEWTDWVLSQYGIAREHLALDRTTSPAVRSATSLISAVLAPRLSAPILAGLLGIPVTRVHDANKTRARDSSDVSPAIVEYHGRMLVHLPHAIPLPAPERSTS